MKRFFKLLIPAIILIGALMLAVSCGGKDGAAGCKVMISLGEGAFVDGENPVTVDKGEDVSFKIRLAHGFCFLRCEGGEYDQEKGILTVRGVEKNTNVNFYTERYEYDPNETFIYLFRTDANGDTTSTRPGSSIPAARLVTVNANDMTRKFIGWSFGSRQTDPELMASTERSFTFRISPEIADGDTVEIFANYSELNKITYDLNGGSANAATVNMKGNTYATVTDEGGRVTVRFSDAYLNFMECASTFYDDGSFTKSGAILKEYNTKPDGTGVAYSLGSKVPLLHDGAETVLYCIWAAESDEKLFEYESITMPNPAGSAAYAPDWVTDGVIITDYLGDESTVVIPDILGGKTVIGIASGAFVGHDLTTLVMGRHIQAIYNEAFVACDLLETVYYPDGIYYINSNSFDEETTEGIKHLYVNATFAPRYSQSPDVGGLAVKLSRLIAPSTLPRIIVIAGSSSYQGLGTEYLETLLDGKYRVINFGTTRTTHGLMYLEAMGYYANSNDTVIYAPENSAYMFGERELYFKTLRDMEGMVNIYRHVDISGYTNVFGAFAELNESRYNMQPRTYEGVVEGASEERYAKGNGIINKYGDYLKADRVGIGAKYYDSYQITLNEYIKSKDEGAWNDVENQQANSNYLDPNNKTWCKITDPYYRDVMNRAITAAKSGGARVYFSFCPVEGDKLVKGANSTAWLSAYDALIDEIYLFDGRVGECRDYVFASEYFYDNAFHLNDYGRTYRTYQLYTDICELLGTEVTHAQNALGTDFDGCLFDGGAVDSPKHPWTPEN